MDKAKGIFVLKVKNGDYGFNPETLKYGDRDLRVEYEDLGDALREFLIYVDVDEYNSNESVKATLTFTYKPEKVKKG